jgi:Uncharacterized protein containing a von Willebrand factor type A (vWA) domain
MLNINAVTTDALGRVGYPVDIKTTCAFEKATLTFQYDEAALGGVKEEDLAIMWFDEANEKLVMLDSAVNKDSNTVSIETTHFSEYLLVDRQQWFQLWRQTVDYGRDPDNSDAVKFYDIVLAIDSSGSMSSNDPGNLRKTAAKQFVDAFLPGDQGAVVDFDDYSYIRAHLTKEKDTLKAAIDEIDSYGGTDIDSAIDTSIYELLSASASESNDKMIILLTDGYGTYNADTTKSAKDNNIKIYTVGLGSGVNDDLLQSIADQTGGLYYKVAQSSDLLDAFKRIEDDTLGEVDTTDLDEDGLYDVYETKGMRNQYLKTIYTNPINKDCDGDSLLDGEEMGSMVTEELPDFIAKIIGVKTVTYFKMRSNPTMADSDSDGFRDDKDTTPLLADKFFDINYYAKAKYGDKPNVTILVDQPYPGSRVVINDSVGHTFIRLDMGNGNVIFKGFYPSGSPNFFDLWLNLNVDGRVLDDNSHEWDIARSYQITRDEAARIKNYIDTCDKESTTTYKYNIADFNCTTFAVEGLKLCDIDVPITKHFWTYSFSVDGAIEFLAKSGVLTVGYGFTPADAGEDLRDTGEYVIDGELGVVEYFNDKPIILK